MDMLTTTRIVLLGKQGAGKSSLANTLFGEDVFEIKHTSICGTSECQAGSKSVHGRRITVVDTPGPFGADRPEEDIVRCITEYAPGPHAFFIVLKVEKFTKQEQAVITKICQYFSEEVFKYATVVFTHGDQLDEGQTIEDFVHQNKLTSDLVNKCGGRCHVVDNKYWKNNQQDEYRTNQFRVERLLKSIDKTLEANEGRYYTNEMLQTVDEEIQQEVELIRQSSGHMSEEEIREQAKDRVSKDLLIKLAGITTGALLGALCGAALTLGEVVTVLKKFLSEPGQASTKIATVTAVGGAIGGTAAVGIQAGAVGATIGLVAIAFVAAGAVEGAFTGYDAAEGAGSPQEAAKRAAKAVKKEALSAFKALGIKAKDKTESKPLMSPDS